MSTGGVQRLISTNPSAETTTEPNAADQAERVQVTGRAEHQQRHADDADARGREPDRAGALTDDQGSERHHRERRRRLERGGEPAGQPVRRQEQQREEHARCCTAPAATPATTTRRDGRRRVTASSTRPVGSARSVAESSGPVRRQQALGDQVRRTPGGGCEGGEEDGAPRG